MNQNNLLVVDFETGSVNPHECQVCSVAGLAINPRTMEPVPGERGEFYSLLRPTDFSKLQQQALDVNKLTVEELKVAPEQSVVFKLFAEWVLSYNPKGRSPFTAPIMCGKNIRNFDMIILQRLCKQHGFVDKGGNQCLFSKRLMIDLEDYLFHWWENSEELPNYKMDTVRPYFGISSENAHNALQDVRDTAALIIKFQQLYRNLLPKIKFKGSLTKK